MNKIDYNLDVNTGLIIILACIVEASVVHLKYKEFKQEWRNFEDWLIEWLIDWLIDR